VFCILVQFIKQIDGEIQTAQQRRRRRQAGRQDENGISQEVNEGVAVRGKKATASSIWKLYMFSGKVLVQGGGGSTRDGQTDQELDDGEQVGGGRGVRKMGAGAGTKKRKTAETNVASTFKIFCSRRWND
jgi:hypothetical protein